MWSNQLTKYVESIPRLWKEVNKLKGQEGGSGTPYVPEASTGNGTVIPLDNIYGYYGNMDDRNAAEVYTVTGNKVGAFAKIKINADNQPVVTGATLIAGADFQSAIDMYMVITYNGAAYEYYFLQITP